MQVEGCNLEAWRMFVSTESNGCSAMLDGSAYAVGLPSPSAMSAAGPATDSDWNSSNKFIVEYL
jgi:hypothetical protein